MTRVRIRLELGSGLALWQGLGSDYVRVRTSFMTRVRIRLELGSGLAL